MTEEKPCGKYHPLPCGLDEACKVPSDYFVAALDNEDIVRLYKKENDIPMDDTLPPGTTHQDIDDNFGSEEPDDWMVGFTLAVDIPVQATSRQKAIKAAKDAMPDEWDVFEAEPENVERR